METEARGGKALERALGNAPNSEGPSAQALLEQDTKIVVRVLRRYWGDEAVTLAARVLAVLEAEKES